MPGKSIVKFGKRGIRAIESFIKSAGSIPLPLKNRPLLRLMALALLLVSALFLKTASTFTINNAAITDRAGISTNIIIPFEAASEKPQNYIIRGNIAFSPISQTWTHIIPDNTVTAIIIGGRAVDLSSISSSALSDYFNGFHINLGPYLKYGNNQIEIHLYNEGGRYAIDFQPSYRDMKNNLINVLTVILILLLLLQIYSALKIKKLFPDFRTRLLIIVLVILAAAVRYFMFSYYSGDFLVFIDWFDYIKSHGGILALKDQFSDYTPFWEYFLALASYLPLPKAAAIKLFLVIFDFLTAGAAALLVNLKTGGGKEPFKPLLAFLAVLFAPTVMFNGSYWGQCDIIYTGFMIASLYYLMKDRKTGAFVLYGLSLAFKFQAVFLSPLYFILFFRKELPLRHFFIIPAMYLLMILPAWVLGRPLSGLVSIYFMQSNMFGSLTMGSPNFYQFISSHLDQSFTIVAMILTLIAVFLLTLIVYRSRQKITSDILIKLSFFILLVMPFFLPRMHERYFFAANIMAIIYAFYFPKYFYLPVIVIMTSFLCYEPFMMGLSVPVPLPILSLVILGVIILVGADLKKSLYPGKQNPPEKI